MQQKPQVRASATSFPDDAVIGLGLGGRRSRYCLLDSAGVVLEENRLRRTDVACYVFASALRFV